MVDSIKPHLREDERKDGRPAAHVRPASTAALNDENGRRVPAVHLNEKAAGVTPAALDGYRM
jgi:hypothetical protein